VAKLTRVKKKTEELHREIVKSRKDLEEYCNIPRKKGCLECPMFNDCPIERVIYDTKLIRLDIKEKNEREED